jgi:hypothetical protein
MRDTIHSGMGKSRRDSGAPSRVLLSLVVKATRVGVGEFRVFSATQSLN